MSLTILIEPAPLVANSDGVVLVGRTRVTLDTIVAMFDTGATAEEIVEQFSSLDLADVYAAISYYLKHQPEVLQYLERRKRSGEQVKLENEQRFPSVGLRDRLLARRAVQSNPPSE